MFISVPNILCH